LTECLRRTGRESNRSSSGSAVCISTCERVRMCARRPMRSSTGLARTLTRARFPYSIWKRGRETSWAGLTSGSASLTTRTTSCRCRSASVRGCTAASFFAVDAGLAPIFHSARRTWIAAYQASEAGLLPHTLWQSTNGQTGANRTNWSGCGFLRYVYLPWHARQPVRFWAGIPRLNRACFSRRKKCRSRTTRSTVAVAFGGGSIQVDLLFSATPAAEGKTPNRPAGWLRTPTTPTDSPISRFVTIGPATQKVTVSLPAGCSGISFQRQDDPGNWATIAYNLGT